MKNKLGGLPFYLALQSNVKQVFYYKFGTFCQVFIYFDIMICSTIWDAWVNIFLTFNMFNSFLRASIHGSKIDAATHVQLMLLLQKYVKCISKS